MGGTFFAEGADHYIDFLTNHHISHEEKIMPPSIRSTVYFPCVVRRPVFRKKGQLMGMLTSKNIHIRKDSKARRMKQPPTHSSFPIIQLPSSEFARHLNALCTKRWSAQIDKFFGERKTTHSHCRDRGNEGTEIRVSTFIASCRWLEYFLPVSNAALCAWSFFCLTYLTFLICIESIFDDREGFVDCEMLQVGGETAMR